MDKKLKEKDPEKVKISKLLEIQKSENVKCKPKFTKLAMKMISKEKEFQTLEQKLNPFINHLFEFYIII